MAKRGRPKLDIKKLRDERDDYYNSWKYTQKLLSKARLDLDALIREYETLEKAADEKDAKIAALNDLVGELSERRDNLLAEIRTYEHEHSTLRQIIIDALRQRD
jgi:uncharacterized coiled-coil DUF342 family protein